MAKKNEVWYWRRGPGAQIIHWKGAVWPVLCIGCGLGVVALGAWFDLHGRGDLAKICHAGLLLVALVGVSVMFAKTDFKTPRNPGRGFKTPPN